MKKYKEIKKIVKDVSSIICDVCGKEFSYNDIVEMQEMFSIEFSGGFGSIFGDGNHFEIDICQHCFKEKLGQFVRIKV